MPTKAQHSPTMWRVCMRSAGMKRCAPKVVKKGMVYIKITAREALVNFSPQ